MSHTTEFPYRHHSTAQSVESWAFTIVGLIMAFIPLALWMSWTPAIFYGLLILFIACYGVMALICYNPFRRQD